MTNSHSSPRPTLSLKTVGAVLLILLIGVVFWLFIRDRVGDTDTAIIEMPAIQPTVEVLPNTPNPIATNNLNILFQDNFDNPDVHWELSSASQGTYEGGAIVLNDTGHADIGWARPHLRFDNMVLNVNTRWVSGSVGGNFGIRFRYVDEGNFYGITIRNDGWYAISRHLNGNQQIIQEEFTDAIDRDGGINTLHIETNGTSIRFFVNNVYLADVIDEEIAPYGDIMFTSFKAEGTERFKVGFDNLIIGQYPQIE